MQVQRHMKFARAIARLVRAVSLRDMVNGSNTRQ